MRDKIESGNSFGGIEEAKTVKKYLNKRKKLSFNKKLLFLLVIAVGGIFMYVILTSDQNSLIDAGDQVKEPEPIVAETITKVETDRTKDDVIRCYEVGGVWQELFDRCAKEIISYASVCTEGVFVAEYQDGTKKSYCKLWESYDDFVLMKNSQEIMDGKQINRFKPVNEITRYEPIILEMITVPVVDVTIEPPTIEETQTGTYYRVVSFDTWKAEFTDGNIIPREIISKGETLVDFTCYIKENGKYGYYGKFQNVEDKNMLVELVINNIVVQKVDTTQRNPIILRGECN